MDVPTMDPSLVLAAAKQLKRNDRQLDRFGAASHRYIFGRPVKARELRAFENLYKVRLPSDYQTFLTEVGNGGPGPGYGVFPFRHHDDLAGMTSFEDGDLIDDPSRPFPHDAAWNVAPEILAEAPSSEEKWAVLDAWADRIDEATFVAGLTDGAIPICHMGCAIRVYLVVAEGEEWGNLWVDDRASDFGIYPLAVQSSDRTAFADWYLDWLRSELATRTSS